MATANRLKELINETHQHGVKLAAEIRALEKKHTMGARAKARGLKVYLTALEVLNRHRRAELQKIEEKAHPKPKPPPAQHRFTMFDAVEISAIPGNPEAVAGYVSGSFPNFDELVRRYPHAKHLSIATTAGVDAMCLDVENGDAVPAQAPGWVRKQHARGLKRPIVYASASTMPTVIGALEGDSIKRDEFMVFVADWRGFPFIPGGADACQYAGEVGRPPFVYDESICEPWFL